MLLPNTVQIFWGAAAAAKSLQSCLILCDPTDSSPPGSPVPGILQARTLEWVAISFSNAWKWKVKVKSLSRVWLLATSWTAAYQASPSRGFSRQEYWSGLPLLSPLWGGDLAIIYFCRKKHLKTWGLTTTSIYLIFIRSFGLKSAGQLFCWNWKSNNCWEKHSCKLWERYRIQDQGKKM